MIEEINYPSNNRCQCNDIMFQRGEHRNRECVGKFANTERYDEIDHDIFYLRVLKLATSILFYSV